jgi:uncharacterized protein
MTSKHTKKDRAGKKRIETRVKESKRMSTDSEDIEEPSETSTKTNHLSNIITQEKLERYFSITEEALVDAGRKMDKSSEERMAQATDFLDMATRYHADAKFFAARGDLVNAFAAINYAHGWLDAGARIRLFKVSDSRLFTVDEKSN